MRYVPDGLGGLTEIPDAPLPVAAAGGEGGRAWEATTVNAVIPSDSREVIPVTVTYGGRPMTTGLSVSLSTRPDSRDWRPLPADGVHVGGLTPGWWLVAVRHTSGAVIEAGQVRVT